MSLQAIDNDEKDKPDEIRVDPKMQQNAHVANICGSKAV